MNSSKLSKSLLIVAALMVGSLGADNASAARGGGGHSGGGRSGHGHGHHHHRGAFFGGSAGFLVGSWYYPGYYWPGYYPGYAYMQQPPVTYYIERADEDAPGDAWYFCPPANAYFPAVTECSTQWQRVPAQP
jgi:hypothetical protein